MQTDIASFLPPTILRLKVVSRSVVQVDLIWPVSTWVKLFNLGEVAPFALVVNYSKLAVSNCAEESEQLDSKPAAVHGFVTQFAHKK